MAEGQAVESLTDDQIEHLREIRVCCCEPGCTRPRCVAPILDGIGADWIGDHFDSLILTIDKLRRELSEAQARTMSDDAFRVMLDLWMCSDPWPMPDSTSQAKLLKYLEAESKARAFSDWVDAYHYFEPQQKGTKP